MKDNDDLLCAVKYLKLKMEQKDATARCATPIVEARPPTPVGRGPTGTSHSAITLVGDQRIELRELRAKCVSLEEEKANLNNANSHVLEEG